MRLINADALIESIKEELWHWDTVDGINATTVLKQTITDIENMPTIEQPHWTPCSEGMPKKHKFVLVTCKTRKDRHFLDHAKWTGDRWVRESDEMYNARSTRVEILAWMPLPEVYREGEQE